MQATGSQAIIPKARGMYAKRLTHAEYEELLRRRTVPEVASVLKRHPYFKDSLATLSITDPHRGQIEELLSMDIFSKYESLVRYDFSPDSFSAYYLIECEMREILRILHLISIRLAANYLNQMPSYLVGKVRIDLLRMAGVRSFPALLEVLRFTPYYKVMREGYERDPNLRNYPLVEAALLQFGYSEIFALAGRSFKGRELEAVRSLFLQEAEIYNLELIVRVKTYFPKAYTPVELKKLLLPYTFHLTKRSVDALVHAPTLESLYPLFRTSGASRYTGTAGADEVGAAGGRVLYRHARRMLHLTQSPAAALAAFISLAKLERENVVNIIEGVRYTLEPEKIRAMLH